MPLQERERYFRARKKTGYLPVFDYRINFLWSLTWYRFYFPVSGKFSDRQKAVYNAVLNVKNEATKMLIPGTNWKQYHVEVGKIMTSELLGLGLITKADVQTENPEWPAYKKYFMHGTSHHMGLDTHDYGLLHEPMQANMVFTVEPGIYIPKEGFGIRLEDDMVIQEKGEAFNLMRNIPIEIEEIEVIMNS